MSEVISILSVQNNPAIPKVCQQAFVANTAVRNVNLAGFVLNPILAGNTVSALPGSDMGKSGFLQGESIRVLSAGVMLPYGFSMAENGFFLRFYAINYAGAFIATILDNSDFFIPYENAEINMDVFLPLPYPVGNFRLVCKIVNATDDPLPSQAFSWAKVSMVNCPAAFNGQTFYAQPFVKILHNFAMVD